MELQKPLADDNPISEILANLLFTVQMPRSIEMLTVDERTVTLFFEPVEFYIITQSGGDGIDKLGKASLVYISAYINSIDLFFINTWEFSFGQLAISPPNLHLVINRGNPYFRKRKAIGFGVLSPIIKSLLIPS